MDKYDELLSGVPVEIAESAWGKDAIIAIRELKEELARIKAPVEGEIAPIAWVRMRDGEIDWAEDCLGHSQDDIQDDCYEEDGTTAAPLYTKAAIESLAAKVAELFEEVAALTEERDWYSTANERAERAEAALAECRSKLEVDPRTKYDGIDCRDETIRMLESKLAEREAELGRYMIANNTLSERAERAEAELAKRRIDVRVVDTAEQAAMKAELANVKEHAATLAMELSLLLDFVRDYRGCKFFAANAALEAYRAAYPKE